MGKPRFGSAFECCLVCGGVVACLLVLLVVLCFLGIGVAKIVMGVIHLRDCSIERMVPIYLIVSGLVPILFAGCGRNDEDGNRSFRPGDVCGIIGFLFQIAWLVCGSIWIYPTYGIIVSNGFVPCSQTVQHDCVHGSCNRDLLKFAFGMLTLDWIFFLIGMSIACSMIFKVCKSR